MNKFALLKRIYPISKFDRECDGYKYIIENTTEEQRNSLGIEINKLKKMILTGEKYIYEVGKFGDKKNIENFQTKYISLENFELIRKKILQTNDD